MRGLGPTAFRTRYLAFGRKALAVQVRTGHSSRITSLFQVPTMLYQIFSHTPHWVWILLLALLWLGVKQAATRTASLQRITVMPVVMIGLSLYGTVTAFGAAPWVLLAWLAAAGVMGALVLQRPLPQATHYNPLERRFTIPGSWVPLMLIMGLFLTKYGLGAATSMHPALALNPNFSVFFGALYGAFSGVFLARAVRLWRKALATHPVSGCGASSAAMP